MINKTYFLCVALMFIATVICRPREYQVPAGATQDEEWQYYKNFFNKTYDNPEEDAKRKGIYFDAKAKIEEHNKKFEAGLVTYSQGINHLTDLTEEEFSSHYLGVKVPESQKRQKRESFSVPEGTSLDDEWAAYKKHFNKNYADADEEAKRKKIYTQNKKSIEDHNKLHAAGQTSYTQIINQWTDLTEDEFVKKHTGIVLPGQ